MLFLGFYSILVAFIVCIFNTGQQQHWNLIQMLSLLTHVWEIHFDEYESSWDFLQFTKGHICYNVLQCLGLILRLGYDHLKWTWKYQVWSDSHLPPTNEPLIIFDKSNKHVCSSPLAVYVADWRLLLFYLFFSCFHNTITAGSILGTLVSSAHSPWIVHKILSSDPFRCLWPFVCVSLDDRYTYISGCMLERSLEWCVGWYWTHLSGFSSCSNGEGRKRTLSSCSNDSLSGGLPPTPRRVSWRQKIFLRVASPMSKSPAPMHHPGLATQCDTFKPGYCNWCVHLTASSVSNIMFLV